jgi:vitamin B12 transporter
VLRFPRLAGLCLVAGSLVHEVAAAQRADSSRYVHAFYRGWESQGLKQFKQVVDAQVTHNIGVSWLFDSEVALLTATVELDNLTDARVYDNFGVQRPGRAFYVKVTGEMR